MVNKELLNEKADDVALAFAYLYSLVEHYAPKEDTTVQAFLPKAKRLSQEVLGNAQGGTNGRNPASDCLRAA